MIVLDIMSSNAGSLIRDNRIWGIQRFLQEQCINILAIQETHLKDQDVENFNRYFPDIQTVVSNGINGERGVAIFCDTNINMQSIDISGFVNTVPGLVNLEPGRLAVASLANNDLAFTLINAYAPNNPQHTESFLQRLMS
jgi:exonuclease III